MIIENVELGTYYVLNYTTYTTTSSTYYQEEKSFYSLSLTVLFTKIYILYLLPIVLFGHCCCAVTCSAEETFVFSIPSGTIAGGLDQVMVTF